MKLQSRFLVTLGLLATVSLAGFSYVIRNDVKQLQLSEIDARLESHLALSEAYVQNLTNNILSDIDLISNDSLTRRYFVTDEVIRYQLFHTELTRTIQRYLKHSELYSEIAIVMPDGFKELYVSDNSTEADDIDRSLKNLETKTVHRTEKVTFVLDFHPATGSWLLSAYNPVRRVSSLLTTDADNPILGYIKISLPLRRVLENSSSKQIITSFDWGDQELTDSRLSQARTEKDSAKTTSKETKVFDQLYLKATIWNESIELSTQALYERSVILIFMAIVSMLLMTILLLKLVILRPLEQFTQLVTQSYLDKNHSIALKSHKHNEFGILGHRFYDLMSRLRESTSKLQEQAFTDTLTGLPNRAALYYLLEKQTQEVKKPLSVLFLDLDGFKQVNDIYGHEVGDELLVEVGKRLTKIVRAHSDSIVDGIAERRDAVIRLGGDEFTIVLVSNQHSEIIADRIIQAFQSGIQMDGKTLYTGASIGISEYPKDATEAALLIQYADLAMYKAKAQGKMRYCCFTEALATEEKKRLEIEERVREGIEFNRFDAHFQAKVDSRTNEIIGLEALARLHDANGKLISPALFIPMAQEKGALEYITYMVTEKTCQLLQRLNNKDMVASINISPSQLNDFRLLSDIRIIMWRYNVEPQQIEFEVTEEELITNFNSARNSLSLIRDFGFRTALDDFGSGYSSLGQLKKFQFDTLKLDRIFVSTEDYDTEASTGVLISIKSLADTLGMSIVAEGIETRDQLKFIESFDIFSIQGFYCAKPMPSDEFLNLYSERNQSAQ
jgi:diguanylate cyclase (GGDEF)-like protein